MFLPSHLYTGSDQKSTGSGSGSATLLMTINEYRAESLGWAWWDFKSASRNGPKRARLHNAGFRCLMFVYRMTYSYRCFIPIPVLVSDASKN